MRRLGTIVGAMLAGLSVSCDRPPAPAGNGPRAAAPAQDEPAKGALETPAALENAFGSPEELVDRLLAALRERDLAAFESLRVSRREYLELLFPHFGLTGSGAKFAPELHWRLLDTDSAKGARRALSEHGGVRYELVEIQRDPETVEYGPYRLLRRVRLKVRAGGEEGTIEFLGSIVAMQGRYKLLSYND